MHKIGVIGAGPAGLMAAGIAAGRGHEVVLFEKNALIGKKLRISGKGRCNITNIADMDELIANIPGNGEFLYSTFNKFSNTDLIRFLNENGLETKVERGGRVFPVSDKASDVSDTMSDFIIKNNVRLMLQSPVKSIEAIPFPEVSEAAMLGRKDKNYSKKVTGVILRDGRKYECDSVILSTGGASYPGTGSSGEGYAIAARLGHKITDLKPGLVPLVISEKWVRELQGLSLRNVAIRFVSNSGKILYEDFGEMLFTHFGVTGPVILSGSRHLLQFGFKDIKLVIDLKPALDEETLDRRIVRDFDKNSRKHYKNALDELLPAALIPVIVMLSGIAPEKPVNQITKNERIKIIRLMKNLTVTIVNSRPLEEAIVTAGGIAVNEINPATMESKLVKGLFFAGEIIDVDAYTGGFNLTIAFSTGYTAGMNC